MIAGTQAFALCPRLLASVTPTHLAQQGGLTESTSTILQTAGILVGIILAGVFVGAFVRRWLASRTDQPVGFTLSDLRDMHAAGDLTDVEFRAARDALVASVKRRSTEEAAKSSKQPSQLKSR